MCYFYITFLSFHIIGEEEHIELNEQIFTSELFIHNDICVLVIQKYTVTFYSFRYCKDIERTHE